jgi:hypothetical protein
VSLEETLSYDVHWVIDPKNGRMAKLQYEAYEQRDIASSGVVDDWTDEERKVRQILCFEFLIFLYSLL